MLALDAGELIGGVDSYPAVINLIRERAEPVNVHASFEISPDPKDDPFCLCSEEGNADFIVTLNPKDFPQERLRAKVISPEAMA